MPYQYLDEMATADVAFKAWGKNEQELFAAACDAVMNILVRDIEKIQKVKECEIFLTADDLEMLLFKFLEELIFLKDSRNLLLRLEKLSLIKNPENVSLKARWSGEEIDCKKHEIETDVKAVTLYAFKLEKEKGLLTATVVVDV